MWAEHVHGCKSKVRNYVCVLIQPLLVVAVKLPGILRQASEEQMQSCCTNVLRLSSCQPELLITLASQYNSSTDHHSNANKQNNFIMDPAFKTINCSIVHSFNTTGPALSSFLKTNKRTLTTQWTMANPPLAQLFPRCFPRYSSWPTPLHPIYSASQSNNPQSVQFPSVLHHPSYHCSCQNENQTSKLIYTKPQNWDKPETITIGKSGCSHLLGLGLMFWWVTFCQAL